MNILDFDLLIQCAFSEDRKRAPFLSKNRLYIHGYAQPMVSNISQDGPRKHGAHAQEPPFGLATHTPPLLHVPKEPSQLSVLSRHYLRDHRIMMVFGKGEFVAQIAVAVCECQRILSRLKC